MNKRLERILSFLITTLFIMALSCSTKDPTQPSMTFSTCSLVWQDDFESNLSNRWRIADRTFDHNLCEFSSNMVTVENGALLLGVDIKSTTEGVFPEKPYWGGECYSASSYMYGRFETVMKPNSLPGLVTSFFLLEVVKDVDNSLFDWYEIDIEFAGKTDEISFALHWMTDRVKQSSVKVVKLDFDAAEAFHKYAIEWTPTSIQFIIDDASAAVFDDSDILKEFQHKMTLHMNYWVSDNAAWAGAFQESVLPQQTSYSSIAYYKLVET
jgi:beta-glucanase (GH16 family)